MSESRIVDPEIELLGFVGGMSILRAIERYGRTCYKSEINMTDNSAIQFVKNLIERGHESVLEHQSVTVRIVCDRGVSHEIVRHRIASYSQESTRYCDYKDEPIKFINIAPFMNGDGIDMAAAVAIWTEHMEQCAGVYHKLRNLGQSPQIARSVLPNSLKTEIVMTCNLREWRHFFRLRASKKAHPQMREIATELLRKMRGCIPVVFEDIYAEVIKCR